MSKKFTELAYKNADELIYGKSKYPVKCKNGLVIGGGLIYPELNFTLPPMLITKETMPEVLKQYKGLVEDALKRATELFAQGVVLEAELLPPTTYNPEWGIEITKVIKEVMNEYEQKHKLLSVLRITPVDIREDKESPHMWHGSHWDKIMQTFEGCAKEGADLLSIESIGGKDLHDDAIMFCEIDKSIFSLGVLGTKDMSKLWAEIKNIANRTGTISAGDTACGFANTAMVLADRGFVPKSFAAVVRVISAVRSLVAIEEGAEGPHKDCGYEGVYVKAITGTPISMEGKSSACAHLSPVGNIAACMADLWSNESIQNIKLLGGMAPTVSMEQLIYDCRLMNVAAESGSQNALLLRNWLADSDAKFDPQAYVLKPDVVFDISKKIVKEDSHFNRTIVAAMSAIESIRNGVKEGKIILDDRDETYLDIMESQIENIPNSEEQFVSDMLSRDDIGKLDPKKYDL